MKNKIIIFSIVFLMGFGFLLSWPVLAQEMEISTSCTKIYEACTLSSGKAGKCQINNHTAAGTTYKCVETVSTSDVATDTTNNTSSGDTPSSTTSKAECEEPKDEGCGCTDDSQCSSKNCIYFEVCHKLKRCSASGTKERTYDETACSELNSILSDGKVSNSEESKIKSENLGDLESIKESTEDGGALAEMQQYEATGGSTPSGTGGTTATTPDSSNSLGFTGIVPCGTDATGPCTLCHLIIGIYRIFKYGLYLVVTAGLVGVFIGGAMYLIASGSEEMINSAKRVISASLIGFSLVLGGWLIVNIILNVLPTDSGLGISKTNWYTFNCNTTSVTGEALKTTEETSKDQVTQRENDPCTPNKAPWCLQGLKCSGEKCIPDETAATTCMKSTTQWVKTDNCASGGTTPEGIRVSATVELASWYCSCRGSKSSEGYKCCDGVVAISAKKQGGCCIGPKDSYKYTKCFDGESLTEDDCYFMTNSGNEKGEYFANKKCVDVTVSGEARKACQ